MDSLTERLWGVYRRRHASRIRDSNGFAYTPTARLENAVGGAGGDGPTRITLAVDGFAASRIDLRVLLSASTGYIEDRSIMRRVVDAFGAVLARARRAVSRQGRGRSAKQHAHRRLAFPAKRREAGPRRFGGYMARVEGFNLVSGGMTVAFERAHAAGGRPEAAQKRARWPIGRPKLANEIAFEELTKRILAAVSEDMLGFSRSEHAGSGVRVHIRADTLRRTSVRRLRAAMLDAPPCGATVEMCFSRSSSGIWICG